MMDFRPYQIDAINAVLDYWDTGGHNPLVAMATGTGKSVVLAGLVRAIMEQAPQARVLILTHVRELIAQNYAAMLRAWPGAPAGINSAGLGKRDTHHPILFASIQSVYKSGKRLGRRDLVVIDEAHLVPKDGEGMYLRLFETLADASPDMRIAGLTATPFRLDSGRLDRGPKRIFSDLVYEYGIADGIRDGFLSPLVSKAPETQIDVSGVQRRGGEFVSGALAAATDKDEITRAAVAEIIALGHDRKSWLAFCAGVDHARHVRDALREAGVAAEMVTGETPKGERDAIVRAFKGGTIRALTNCDVLTTGFDAPGVDLIAMLRATCSPGLYIQIAGRGTRLAADKRDCLILDFAGNVRRHGPVDAVLVDEDGKTKGSGENEPLAKECPSCESLIGLAARSCPHCGHIFPPPEDKPKHEAKADTAPILTGALPAPPEWLAVADVSYHLHAKPGMTPSLRVDYTCGIGFHSEWVCLQHTGFAREKAERWWLQSGGHRPVPEWVDTALARIDELRAPSEIAVKKDGKYWRVVARRFEKERQAA